MALLVEPHESARQPLGRRLELAVQVLQDGPALHLVGPVCGPLVQVRRAIGREGVVLEVRGDQRVAGRNVADELQVGIGHAEQAIEVPGGLDDR